MERTQVRPSLLCACDGWRTFADPQHQELLMQHPRDREKSLTQVGIEPTISRLDHHCSTDWATRPDGSRPWEFEDKSARPKPSTKCKCVLSWVACVCIYIYSCQNDVKDSLVCNACVPGCINMQHFRLSTRVFHIQLFWERLSEKVHATILCGWF